MPEIDAAREITPIATVQNLYNLTQRGAEGVVEYCERERIGFIPWFRWQRAPSPDPMDAHVRPAPQLDAAI